MTAKRDLERRLTDFYASEAPNRAPDWVLERALDAIDQTKQQRPVIGALRRIPAMSTFSKVAAAAVVIVGVVAVGAMVARPGPGPGGPGPSASTSPSASPVRTPGPSPSNVAPSPPPLSETFTSTIHGYSIDHPAGWIAIPATATWAGQGLIFGAPEGDTVHDPALTDHLFFGISSMALDGTPGADWGTDWLATEEAECSVSIEPITIDGSDGLLCGPGIAVAWVEDRGYVFRLYTSGDEWWLAETYGEAFFRNALATVDLRPDEAVVAAAPSPSP